MYHVHTGVHPTMSDNCVVRVFASGSRYGLRLSDTADYILPRTWTKFEECGFCFSCPAAWNGLPTDLHYITNTELFKTVLFDRVLLLCIVTVLCS